MSAPFFNLANAITVARIILAPVVAAMPFIPSWQWRAWAFVLYLIVAISDYWDGWYARKYGQVSDTGKLLDPLADKIFLVGVLLAMYALQAPLGERLAQPWLLRLDDGGRFPFAFTLGSASVAVPLPAWVLLIVFAREIAMTVFRQMAQRRGVVIGASRIAKWKTGFQFVWMGTAYAWFTFATLGERMGWIANADAPLWHSLALFTTLVGAVAMIASVVLALWSLWEYVMKYGHVFTAARPAVRRP